MRQSLPLLNQRAFPAINRGKLETLQVNLGYKCNLSCLHCHVSAGPNRQEMMTDEGIESILEFIDATNIQTLDVTGGAPEMHPKFKYLVEQTNIRGVKFIDRCNLTILLEPGFEDMAYFLARHRVEIVASLPCYLKDNVDKQRGKGVYENSIIALKILNEFGYGKSDSGLVLNLVYNPQGPVLPPPQESLQDDYKNFLRQHFDVTFNNLLTIANMPIGRFGSVLISKKQFNPYMDVLTQAYNRSNLETVMCKNLISVDWQGYVYDCDFNQMLDLPLKLNGSKRLKLQDLLRYDLSGNSIVVRDHCFGCTAGQGSSCGGALN